MRIRRFTEGDELALLPVFLSSLLNIASRDYTPEQIAAWASAASDQAHWLCRVKALHPFVVEVGREIVGYADVQPDGYIDHFYVSGAWAGKGVGTLLMKRIHEEARLSGVTALTARVSKTAEPFFLRQGFEIVQRTAAVRCGVRLPNALMRKVLNRN